MKKSLLLFILSFLSNYWIIAQTTGNVELKDNGYSPKKFSNAPKKIFIAQFRVNYQIMFDYTETAQGGSQLGGGVRGTAKSRLALGIKGISEEDLKEITDKLYITYVEKLKSEGFEIIYANEAGKISTFSEFERKTGGTLSTAQFPGYIMSIPTGYEYFVKGTSSKGREKSTFVDNSARVSFELGGAIVARINLVVPFISDAESQASKMLSKASGGIAKVVMKTDLKLTNEMIAASGAFATDLASTQANYAYASKKIGVDAVSNFVMKDPVPVKGVFEDKKYKAVETANFDFQGTNYGLFSVFSAEDSYFEKMQAVSCEPASYKNGVFEAGNKFLDATLQALFSNSK